MTESSTTEKISNKMNSPIVVMGVAFGGMVIILCALQGWIPAAAGSIALGLLEGTRCEHCSTQLRFEQRL